MAVPRTRIKIYDQPLHFFLNTPDSGQGDKDNLWKYIDRRLNRTIIRAKRDVGVKSGALRDSIYSTHRGNSTGQYAEVIAPLSYALAHHNGTRPHIIKPDKAPQLVFMSKSRLIRTSIVKHPGTKANRFLFKNLDVLAGLKRV
jgi:hypothetical protein